ncbi:hypothetical protein [Megalodesulfovibrio paquesii]
MSCLVALLALTAAPQARAQSRDPFTPSIPEEAVRKWFATVKLPGFKQVSLYHEFHPVDGSLVARYEGGGKVVYLSFIDNVRKDPTYGFRRDAKTMAQVGGKLPPASKEIAGARWHGNDSTPSPVVALDVSQDVKILLVGYEHVSLDELYALAGSLTFDILKQAHR